MTHRIIAVVAAAADAKIPREQSGPKNTTKQAQPEGSVIWALLGNAPAAIRSSLRELRWLLANPHTNKVQSSNWVSRGGNGNYGLSRKLNL